MPSSLRRYSLSITLILALATAQAQSFFEPADSLHRGRVLGMASAQGSVYASTLTGLHFAWYAHYDRQRFHLFNDWPGWMQMDKLGHSAAAYQTARILYAANRWTGARKRSSLAWSVGLGYSYQLAVEVMDGFSSGWGFSGYDQLFNTIGSATFLTQQLAWDEQRIKLKFSFSPSGLHHAGPYGLYMEEARRADQLFGTALYEQWLKDYNGQTYWVSVNIWSLIGKPERFPKWLNLAAGYSVNNVLGAERNAWYVGEGDNARLYTSNLQRERQWLLSLDIDLDHVPLPHYLTWVRSVVGVIKVPFPALELNTESGLRLHPVYF